MAIDMHPVGVVLAITFVSSMAILFLWMFHVPPALPRQVVKVHGSIDAVHKMVVPIVEAMPSERAVELACRMGNGKKADLVLVHVIVVPYIMPLDAPLPEREQAARAALDIGSLIAQQHGCHVQTCIVRHRSAAEGILQTAREVQADVIVLGVGIKSRVPGEWGKTSAEILRRAECEVFLDKAPIHAQPIAASA